jgi:hypothetical protein
MMTRFSSRANFSFTCTQPSIKRQTSRCYSEVW